MEEQMAECVEVFDTIRGQMRKVVVGQALLIERLLLALLCDGHVLLEGIPGVAKTLTVNVMAQSLNASFSRLQFTPDLLPGDLIGTLIYNPQSSTFTTEKGPIFANIVLADEVNRSPAKVQSALLEAMQERQVTIGSATYPLPHPFLVLATQNPIEQEGTYELPEAQVDRFMFKVIVGYPDIDEEHEILRRMGRSDAKTDVDAVVAIDRVTAMRPLIDQVYMDEQLERYILRLVHASRMPREHGLDDVADYLRFGASPRATIFLAKAARGAALMAGRDSVLPQDIKGVAPDVLRHRLAISYQGDAAGITSEHVIRRLLDTVSIQSG